MLSLLREENPLSLPPNDLSPKELVSNAVVSPPDQEDSLSLSDDVLEDEEPEEIDDEDGNLLSLSLVPWLLAQWYAVLSLYIYMYISWYAVLSFPFSHFCQFFFFVSLLLSLRRTRVCRFP